MGERVTIRRPLALGAAATIGFGSLFFANPAFAEEGAEPTATESQESAVASLDASDKYELAAAQTSFTVEEVKGQEAAGDLIVAENGFVAHVDPAQGLSTESFEAADFDAIPGDPAGGSRPGAPVTIYLDFDGEVLEDKQWNLQSGEESLNFAPSTGIDEANVWAAVAEDYAPFNVNVTTTNPGADALYKTSEDDNQYGSHVIITDSYDDVLPAAAGSGGIAWLGGAGSEFMSGALVFTQGTGSDKAVAEAASHEAGHNFGLSHDGHGSEEYYNPTEGLWGPIMGAGYQVPVTQWSAGAYAGSTQSEDDLQVITDRSSGGAKVAYLTHEDGSLFEGEQYCYDGDPAVGPRPGDNFWAVTAAGTCDQDTPLEATWTYTDRADFAADDHGDDAGSATQLDNSATTFEDEGVIGNTDDVDAFTFTTAGGAVDAAVEVAPISANLNAQLTLLNEDGDVVAEDAGAPTRESGAVASGLGASISEDVAEGTYTLLVEGVGFGDPQAATGTNAGGFTDYGSLGQYSLSGNAAPGEEQPDPETPAPVITAPETGSEQTEAVTEIAGTGVAGATVEVAGEVTGEATVGDNGSWTVPADITENGEYTVTATQTVGEETSEAASTTFTVNIEEEPEAPAAPKITSIPADKEFTEADAPSSVSGTGENGASITVTVGGEKYTSEATPEWTADFGEQLAPGEYQLTATQSVDGVTSEPATVNFSVVADSDANPGGDDDSNGNADGGNGGSEGTDGGSDSGAGDSEAGTDDGDLANTGFETQSMPPYVLGALGMIAVGGAAIFLARRKTAGDEI